MAFVNRDKDVSEKRDDRVTSFLAATGVATTVPIHMAAYPSQIDVVRAYCGSSTGTPALNLAVRRNLSAGVTVLVNLVGTTLTLASATGPLGYTLFTGASAFQLQSGDLVFANIDGVTALSIALVVQGTQDIKTWYGV